MLGIVPTVNDLPQLIGSAAINFAQITVMGPAGFTWEGLS